MANLLSFCFVHSFIRFSPHISCVPQCLHFCTLQSPLCWTKQSCSVFSYLTAEVRPHPFPKIGSYSFTTYYLSQLCSLQFSRVLCQELDSHITDSWSSCQHLQLSRTLPSPLCTGFSCDFSIFLSIMICQWLGTKLQWYPSCFLFLIPTLHPTLSILLPSKQTLFTSIISFSYSLPCEGLRLPVKPWATAPGHNGAPLGTSPLEHPDYCYPVITKSMS